MPKLVWNDETIKECVLKNTKSEYLGYEIEYKQYADRKRKRIYVKLICEQCGTEYRTNIDIIKQGGSKWCRECIHQKMIDENKKHDIKTVETLFKEKGLKLLDKKYINNSVPLTALNSEGYKVEISYNNLLKGYGAAPFSSENPHTIDNIKLFIKRSVSGYKLLSKEYIKADGEKLLFECNKGHIFESSWNDFRNGTRCPVCNNSKGEEAIRKFLESKNIEYIQEYRFNDCRNKNPLPFDFYLPEYNICIEYDGRQHFEQVDWFGGIDGFKERKRNDNIKDNYCKVNGVHLIRIPYIVENIAKYLDKQLLKINKPLQQTLTK